MDALLGAMSWYAALPAAVMVMIGIFLVGLLLARLKVLDALRSAIYVAAAIVGMNAMVGVFSGAATPVLQLVVESTGLKLNIIDLGVGSSYASVLFPLSFYSILLVVGPLVNAAMILLKFTDTFDVDVFNYSVQALAASYVWVITGSIPLAILAYAINEVIVLKFANLTAPAIEKAYGLDGVSIPHGNAVIFAPVGMFMNWVIEKIPALAKIDWSPEKMGVRTNSWTIRSGQEFACTVNPQEKKALEMLALTGDFEKSARMSGISGRTLRRWAANAAGPQQRVVRTEVV